MKGISALSHWVDDSMPERVRETLIRANVDADKFQQRIGPLLHIYRGSEHVKSNMPQQSEEADFVRRLSDLLAEAAQQMTRSAIPPRTHALLLSVFHIRLGENWHELQDRVLRDLQMAQAALRIVGRRLLANPAKRGAKTKQGRDELLQSVIDEITRQLGPPKKRAQITALEVLRAYEIAVPSPDQNKSPPEKAAARAAKMPHRN